MLPAGERASLRAGRVLHRSQVLPSKTPDPAIADVDKLRVNQEILADEVRVVEPDGDHEVVPIEEARGRARDHDLDLVEVAPDADPPVCKVLDYGKYRYEKQKEEQRRRKK